MQAVLADAQKPILKKLSIELNVHNKTLLRKGLKFAPTLDWSRSVENAKWPNAQQQGRRTETCANYAIYVALAWSAINSVLAKQ